MDIHEVVDHRAVTTAFQPLIDIATREVIGLEALTRGPANSPLTSPLALFDAAREAGREAELDWVCRANAYRIAVEHRMPREVALFVNLEPASWRAECPPDLRDAVSAAADRLCVVTEMTERAIADDPAALLSATAASRSAGWGVAMDDVGAEAASLALMPFVAPDVVKLDMRLVRRPADAHTARVVSAVLAYAEASGAVVLAEGIETEAQLATALAMGATIGQGWLFGRPAAFPDRLRAPAAPLRRIPAVTGAPLRTPYEVVTAARTPGQTTKRLLMPLSRYLEGQARHAPEPPVLLSCFQEARFLTPATVRRYAELTERSPFVAALAVGFDAEPAPGVRGARLDPGDPLRGEWNVIVVGPHHAAALVARDLGDTGPESERRFSYVLTHDRTLVVEAARTLLRYLAPVPRPLAVAH